METDCVFHRDYSTDFPIIAHGEGCLLVDENGRKYLDGSSGAIAANLGHSNEAIAKAIYNQALKAGFVHTLRFETPIQHQLAAEIASLAPEDMNTVFFASGGSEANESALKLCRQLNRDRGKATKFINIGRWQSYHGNTLGSLSVGGDALRRMPYAPQLTRSEHVDSPYYGVQATEESKRIEDERCLKQLEKVIVENGADSISAIIMEPIVGSQQGAIVPTNMYLQGVRRLCDQYDVYMIIDEIMTGFYRTGESFAIHHTPDVIPDIITFGKGVSAGYAPLSGMVIHDQLIEDLKTFSDGKFLHGFTYSGHPVSLAAGYETLQQYKAQNVQQNIEARHAQIIEFLKALQQQSSIIADVRGKGLLIGVEFVKNTSPLQYFEPKERFAQTFNDLAMSKGAVFYPGSGTVDGQLGEHILIAPPLNIKPAETEKLLQIFKETLLQMEKDLKNERVEV